MPRITKYTTVDELIALGIIKPNQAKAIVLEARKKFQVAEYVREERERKARIQRFHDEWKEVFTKKRWSISHLFCGIGHNPNTVKQYTPQNVTRWLQRMKEYEIRERKYAYSFSLYTMLLFAITVSI